MHFEIEVVLLPGGEGLLLHVVSRLAIERQSVSQLVHDWHRFFGIDTLVHQHTVANTKLHTARSTFHFKCRWLDANYAIAD